MQRKDKQQKFSQKGRNSKRHVEKRINSKRHAVKGRNNNRYPGKEEHEEIGRERRKSQIHAEKVRTTSCEKAFASTMVILKKKSD